jgi:hypothetical protein
VASSSARQPVEHLVPRARRDPQGRIRRITIVAVARKLLIAQWRYLETGVVLTDRSTDGILKTDKRNIQGE